MTLRPHTAVGLLGLSIAPLFAESEMDSLVRNSPFLPAATAPAQQEVTSSPLDRFEFRGVFSLGGINTFNLIDTGTQNSLWLRMNESEGGLRVTNYDRGNETIVLEGEGRSRKISLKEAQIITLNIQSAPAPAAAEKPAPDNTIRTEAEKLQERRQKVVEELRRRRVQRQEAMQKMEQQRQQQPK